ncbi:transposable element Tc1 transposase [Trichonephila clavipes]|uniref:Transposable element Tc1 transposase n=1 Tax=Trichonephila clavipes TaxID=2585209 RepID=A0A8X6VQH7_TRICX|nr:transposable element Tc1 transposase [Trichonephila clavipes]
MHGTLTDQRYVDDILRPHVGPFLNGLPGAIFQEDNARPHTARVVQDFLLKFEQILEFERGRIVGLREAGLSYRAVAARVQRNSSTIMRVSNQWTDEGRTARNSGSGPRNVTSAREDRRLVRIAQTDRTAFSK